jgi:hypothetical protein
MPSSPAAGTRTASRRDRRVDPERLVACRAHTDGSSTGRDSGTHRLLAEYPRSPSAATVIGARPPARDRLTTRRPSKRRVARRARLSLGGVDRSLPRRAGEVRYQGDQRGSARGPSGLSSRRVNRRSERAGLLHHVLGLDCCPQRGVIRTRRLRRNPTIAVTNASPVPADGTRRCALHRDARTARERSRRAARAAARTGCGRRSPRPARPRARRCACAPSARRAP